MADETKQLSYQEHKELGNQLLRIYRELMDRQQDLYLVYGEYPVELVKNACENISKLRAFLDQQAASENQDMSKGAVQSAYYSAAEMNIPEEKGDDASEEKRRYFRVVYPPEHRPVLFVRKTQYPVIDISEKGIRYISCENDSFVDWVVGKLVFKDGSFMDLQGRIVRRGGDDVSLFLITPIPYKTVLEEERKVRLGRTLTQPP